MYILWGYWRESHAQVQPTFSIPVIRRCGDLSTVWPKEFNHYTNNTSRGTFKRQIAQHAFLIDHSSSRMWGNLHMVGGCEPRPSLAWERRQKYRENTPTWRWAISLVGQRTVPVSWSRDMQEKQWDGTVRNCLHSSSGSTAYSTAYTYDNNYFYNQYQGIPLADTMPSWTICLQRGCDMLRQGWWITYGAQGDVTMTWHGIPCGLYTGTIDTTVWLLFWQSTEYRIALRVWGVTRENTEGHWQWSIIRTGAAIMQGWLKHKLAIRHHGKDRGPEGIPVMAEEWSL